MEPKPKIPLLSKTLWVNLILAVTALVYPPANEYVSAHPELVMLVVSGLNIVLRLVTKEAIQIL